MNEVLTNYELAMWLAGENGQVCYNDRLIRTQHDYYVGEEQRPVNKDTKIRKWGYDGWSTPTRSYINE